MSRFKKFLFALSVFNLFLLFTTQAFAFTTPSANSILYPVYNLLIVNMINNGGTYIIGFITILIAGYFFIQQKIAVSLFCFIGAILVLAAGSITTAFGYIF